MGIVLQEVGAPIRSRGVTHDSFFDDIVAETRRYVAEEPPVTEAPAEPAEQSEEGETAA